MKCPRAAVFDLDDTLAESFKSPSDDMLDKLGQLLRRIPVAIMTGAGFKRMEEQFLGKIVVSPHADRFYLFPNSSAQCYVRVEGAWNLAYNFALGEQERARIKETILKTVDESEVLRNIPHYGQQLFDREAQVAYTPVGVEASLEAKRGWDIDGSKRALLFQTLQRALPEFEVLLGGRTTIDITRKGINKSYGVQWLSAHLEIPTKEILYVGDAFHDGGNDRVVIPTGIATRVVSGPAETEKVLDELIVFCAASR